MSSYLIGQISIKNEKLWNKYVEGVKISLEPFDANVVFRGKKESVLSGNNDTDFVVVIEFINANELDTWFNSKKYQSLIALRDESADVTITTYNEY